MRAVFAHARTSCPPVRLPEYVPLLWFVVLCIDCAQWDHVGDEAGRDSPDAVRSR
jgi:hypothetical protein